MPNLGMRSHRALGCSLHPVSTRNILRLPTAPVSTIKPSIARLLLSQEHRQHTSSYSRPSPKSLPRLVPEHLLESQRRGLYPAGTNNMDRLKYTLHPDIPSDVLSLWFNHISSPEHLILPPKEAIFKWFKADSDFDQTCAYVFAFLPSLFVYTV